jgi:hypothetical protein
MSTPTMQALRYAFLSAQLSGQRRDALRLIKGHGFEAGNVRCDSLVHLCGENRPDLIALSMVMRLPDSDSLTALCSIPAIAL